MATTIGSSSVTERAPAFHSNKEAYEYMTQYLPAKDKAAINQSLQAATEAKIDNL